MGRGEICELVVCLPCGDRIPAQHPAKVAQRLAQRVAGAGLLLVAQNI